MRKFCSSQDYSPSAHRVARQLSPSAFIMLWMPHLTIDLRAKASSCPSPQTHLCCSTWAQWGPQAGVWHSTGSLQGFMTPLHSSYNNSFTFKGKFLRKMPGGIPSFPGNTEGVLFQIQIQASWMPKVITDFGFTLLCRFMLLYLQVYSARAAPLLSSLFPKLSARVELLPSKQFHLTMSHKSDLHFYREREDLTTYCSVTKIWPR